MHQQNLCHGSFYISSQAATLLKSQSKQKKGSNKNPTKISVLPFSDIFSGCREEGVTVQQLL
jgi:hypothetical protein